jgi:hypothetical protein
LLLKEKEKEKGDSSHLMGHPHLAGTGVVWSSHLTKMGDEIAPKTMSPPIYLLIFRENESILDFSSTKKLHVS